ncbi:dihydroxyacetone kinase phosphoryl donor subunit DhaM [Staphylococcus lugdunensis]|uniref:dihydroxyacetone kinase phosphoryl donor subunit DhaM n=1 Tax=Staphylococcus lugdunensis TaxID=28035 RepID=UPI000A197B2C|nr:dihydroxyacetone kinase phosphoryl donor subunit DhaM [Staphylococcus lugdunensis]ARJ19582.1 PTS mannose transporter subunit IIA [Staphylococcus lugdunensis]
MTAIVLVSHSEAIANGTKDLLKDISKDVNIIAYGGENHKYRTSADDILTILNQLEEDALCFYDLGSADMNLDLAIEAYDGSFHIYKVNAPIVEGSFTATVNLSMGETVDKILNDIEQYSFKKSTF